MLPLYTSEQKEWLKENYQGKCWDDIVSDFNKAFEDTKTKQQLRNLGKKLGVYPHTRNQEKIKYYKKDYLEWMNANWKKHNSYITLAESFNKCFSTKISYTQARQMIAYLGINPHWKKVYEDGKVVNTERGKRIKINGKFVQFSRAVYEQHFRKLKSNEVIIYLDGNRDNVSPDNLYAVDKGIRCLMNTMNFYTSDKKATLACIKWCELILKINERKK